jgi:PAS domain S-box-containing protein
MTPAPVSVSRVRGRELSLLAGVVVAVLALGWIVARDVRQSADDASQLYERLSHGLNLIDDLQFNAQEVRRILLYALHTSDANLQLQYAEQSRAAAAQVQTLIDSGAAVMPARTRRYLGVVGQRWQHYLVVRDDVTGLILERSLPEAVALDQSRGTARFNDVRQALADLKASFESDAATQVEYARARADRATWRLTLLVVSALLTAAVGIYLINRRAALEGLLRIEAHKGSILQAVPDPIVSTDAEGRIVELNEAAERTFGFSRADALGTRLEEVIVPERVRAVLTVAFARMPEAPRTVWPRIETIARRLDGTQFPVELAAVTHTVGPDRIWTVHIADMTAWRQAEEQLRRAKEAAEAADRAKSEFLATMSHELRTPLSGVIGIADLLQNARLTASQTDLVRMLRSSASALLGLVSDILDYSRVEAGQMNLIPVSFSIQSLIEDALDPVTEAAARKGLDLGYVIGPEVPALVLADQDRVRQVLLNLLSNAVKFTETGEIAVHVGATAAGAGSALITVRVRDSGSGIPAHLHDQLFQRFTQLQRSPGGPRGGAGLGLAISERLSRLLGGTLSVDSAPGVGSTFTFVFAAGAAPSGESTDPVAGSLAGVRVVALVGPGVVGDQIRSLLARWGTRLRVVVRNSDAPLPAGDEAFDAVVVDGDAWDGGLGALALHELTALGAHLPVVMIRRLRSSPVREFEPAGLVIAKPVRASALHEALCAATGVARPTADLKMPSPPGELFASDSLAVLLVEDNDANRRVVQLMLEDLGLKVDEAADGFQAIERARSRQYDVILMDVQMPGLDGLQAARRIRVEQRVKPPIILALTANVMEGDEAKCREAGMDGYLSKPLRLETLAAVLAPLASQKS